MTQPNVNQKPCYTKEYPLWFKISLDQEITINCHQLSRVMTIIADSIPCFRLSGGIDFSTANDVRYWLRSEALKARLHQEQSEQEV